MAQETVEDALRFVDEMRAQGKSVLVHCFQGRSRSVAIILLYLMKKCKMTLAESVGLLESKKVVHRLNQGFMQFLEDVDSESGSKPPTHKFLDRRMRAAKVKAQQELRRARLPPFHSTIIKQEPGLGVENALDQSQTVSSANLVSPKRIPPTSGRKPHAKNTARTPSGAQRVGPSWRLGGPATAPSKLKKQSSLEDHFKKQLAELPSPPLFGERAAVQLSGSSEDALVDVTTV